MPLEQIVRKAIDMHLRYVSSVGRLTADSLREFIDTVAASTPRTSAVPSPGPEAPSRSAPSMVLEAEAGKAALGVFLVENFLAEPIEAAIVASKLADPRGNTIELPFAFDPPKVSLKPREQVLVRVAIVIPESVDPDTSYSGIIAVPELKGTNVPIVVRRRLPATA